MNLREAARDQACIRCGKSDGSVVLAHYTGPRRLAYGGGFAIKVNDLAGAHLCSVCHVEMDSKSRVKALKWEHSEEFLHLCFLTILRLAEQGHVKW